MINIAILQGVPGSRKSSLCKVYQSQHPDEIIHIISADDYMVNEKGEYLFDPSKLGKCHQKCLLAFMEKVINLSSLKEEHPPTRASLLDHTIFVDNTNCTVVEIAPYMAIAMAYGLEPVICSLTDIPLDLCHNIHGVPADQVAKMEKTLKDSWKDFPPWWRHQILTPTNNKASSNPLDHLRDQLQKLITQN